MTTFRRNTIIVLIVLAVVVGIAWFLAPGEHFVRVSLICYGDLLGWFSSWFVNLFYSRKEPKQWTPGCRHA
jgi:Zn-dependent protease with chaperone function